jgi:orotidine-5'-phosphate decarboxylase
MNQQTAKNRPAHFADALALAVRRFGTPAIVGLDPRWENLPPAVALRHKAGWQDQADAYLRFCRGVIDVVAPLVAAVKPQAAFFEQLGPAGMAALGQVIQYARERGLIVVIDGKRNDIGSTAQAYAEGFLGAGGQSAWSGDALTVSPYLGDDSLAPFVEVAQARGCGIFVLVKTSNPGGRTFQDLLADGRPIYRHVAEHVERLAISTAASCGYGAVGAVVGATYPDQLSELRSAMPHAWFLIPGYGAQGGAAQDVAGAFDDAGLGAIVNSSRAIIFAHARREYAGGQGVPHGQRARRGEARPAT